MECSGCVYDYYECDCNYWTCRHLEYDIENPDDCPGYISIEDARADSRRGKADSLAFENMAMKLLGDTWKETK